MILAKCCDILLRPVYRIGREEIADSLTEVIVLDGVVAEGALVLDVLRRFGDRSVDFADAMWAQWRTNGIWRLPRSIGIIEDWMGPWRYRGSRLLQWASDTVDDAAAREFKTPCGHPPLAKARGPSPTARSNGIMCHIPIRVIDFSQDRLVLGSRHPDEGIYPL